MLQEMERRADRAATILAGVAAGGKLQVLLTHERSRMVALAVAMAAELEQETLRSFNEPVEVGEPGDAIDKLRADFKAGIETVLAKLKEIQG
jgi:hypothetical protein